MKKIVRFISLTLCLSMLFASLTACTSSSNDPKPGGSDPETTGNPNQREDKVFEATGIYAPSGNALSTEPADVSYVTASNAFAIAMMNALGDEWTGVVSPLSLQLAFEMLANGGNAEAQALILSALGIEDDMPYANLNVSRLLNAFMQDADASSRTSKNSKKTGASLIISNAVVADAADKLNEEFVSAIADYYKANLGTLDFSEPKASADSINQWISNRTSGQIEKLLDESALKDASAVLLCAMLFEAKWQSAFSVSAADWTFSGASGETPVKMITATGKYQYNEFDNAQMVLIPYAGGEYYMAVVLPSEGTSVAAAMSSVIGKWDECEDATGSLTMPKIDLNTDLNAEEVLSKLGLGDVVGGNVLFSNILENSSLFVSHVAHSAHMTVDETGTKASAASGIVATKNHLPSLDKLMFEMECNRPYGMAIVHAQTGAVAFMAAVNDVG